MGNRQQQAANGDDTPTRGSLHEAVIGTEPKSFRSEAETLVGALVAEIESLDDDPTCGPAAGVGLSSQLKGGWGYWQHVRKLILDAIDGLPSFLTRTIFDCSAKSTDRVWQACAIRAT